MINRLAPPLLTRLPLPISRAMLQRNLSGRKTHGDTPKQLLIDISGLIRYDSGTGVQRVVRGITPRLMENPPDGYVVYPVFAERGRGYRYAPVTAALLQADEPKRRYSRPVTVNDGDIFLGLDPAVRLLPRHGGQLLHWKRRGGRFGFLVHDLLPLLHPQWFKPGRYAAFSRWLRYIALFGDDLICVSETVRSDLRRWLAARCNLKDSDLRLHTIPLGADIEATLPSAGCAASELTLLERIRRKPYILMVGTIEPRKGYAQALQAFERLWRDGGETQLVIVGKPGWKTEILQERMANHAENGKKLFWFDRASDELLRKLYQSSGGILAASEAEGYGLPLAEAAYFGKPALARDIPVFREVAAPGVSFFESASFVESLQEWVRRIQGTGFTCVSAPLTSWADSATELSEIISGMAR